MGQSPIKKEYLMEGCHLGIDYQPRLIRVEHPEELVKYLSTDIKARTFRLARLIKAEYRHLYGIELKISERSIVAEIWGHVFASYLAKGLKRKFRFEAFLKFVDFIIARSDRIDCGERNIDSNRWFWDALSPFIGALLWLIKKSIKKQ